MLPGSGPLCNASFVAPPAGACPAGACPAAASATASGSRPRVSHHLRVLRAHGLVRARRQGKMVFYSPDDAHIRLLLDITREHVVHGPEGAAAGGAAAPSETLR